MLTKSPGIRRQETQAIGETLVWRTPGKTHSTTQRHKITEPKKRINLDHSKQKAGKIQQPPNIKLATLTIISAIANIAILAIPLRDDVLHLIEKNGEQIAGVSVLLIG